jgi:excisionase family DNA binding protein
MARQQAQPAKGCVMTLDDLADRLFANVPEVAEILGADERTVRRAVAAGEIPATRIGVKCIIPVSWLRERAGSPTPASAETGPDLEQLAERVAERLFARFGRMFGEAQDMSAVTDTNPPAQIEQVHGQPPGRRRH